MIPENAKLARSTILELAREATTCGAVLRSMAVADAEVNVVIGVDREVWDMFTDEDGPVREYPTFVSRRLTESPDAVEITAFRDTDE